MYVRALGECCCMRLHIRVLQSSRLAASAPAGCLPTVVYAQGGSCSVCVCVCVMYAAMCIRAHVCQVRCARPCPCPCLQVRALLGMLGKELLTRWNQVLHPQAGPGPGPGPEPEPPPPPAPAPPRRYSQVRVDATAKGESMLQPRASQRYSQGRVDATADEGGAG